MEKKRHGFVTLWLWLMLLSYLALAIFMIAEHDMAIWIYATEEKAQLFFYGLINGVDFYCNSMIVIGGLCIVGGAGIIMLLKWKKAGYWTIIGTSVINTLIMLLFAVKGGVSEAVVWSIIGAIVIPLVLYGVLQLRMEDKSCWGQLE